MSPLSTKRVLEPTKLPGREVQNPERKRRAERWDPALALGLLILFSTSLSSAQSTSVPTVTNGPASVDGAEEDTKQEGLEGLWPSPVLLKIMLVRWAEESGEEYDLDGEQRAKVRTDIVARWEKFLTDERATIQPLVNEFIEMRMELAPPSKDRVHAWAERAYPMFEKSREQIRESHDEFRKVLRPMQRVPFEVDALKMGAGMAVAEQKLKQWTQGEFEKDEFWEPLPAERRATREEGRKRRAEREASAIVEVAPTGPADQIAVEVERWEKYVADFVRRFRLDEGQRNAALSCLTELKGRALAHRDRHREDIGLLERRIAEFNGSQATLADLKKQLTGLYGPVDEMFKELQSRLDQVPTTDQKSASQVNLEPPRTDADAP